MKYVAHSSLASFLLLLAAGACSGPPSDSPVLTAEIPLHLEEHLEAATIVGSEVPTDLPQPVVWSFDEEQPEWKILPLGELGFEPTQLTQTDDALRVTLESSTEEYTDYSLGAFYVDVPDWMPDDWARVQVRARTSDNVQMIGMWFNLPEEPKPEGEAWPPFRFWGDQASVINDGTVHTYSLRADFSGGQWEGSWRELILYALAEEPGSIDILSVMVIPKEAGYAGEPVGTRAEVRNKVYRRALYNHAPARLEYEVLVPESGRLDFGLGVLRDDYPVTFRLTANAEGGEPEPLLEEDYSDKENWAQRSVDLSHLAGQTVTLALETDSERAGTIALWGAPTLTAEGAKVDRPNVVFYVIDGGAADYMSAYGYNRRTTPNIERLAAEGAFFERAYSNSTWTKPSTASFMTSLQHSVMGGTKSLFSDPVPEQVLTMAEHVHQAGYQTGVFVANPNAGTLSNLQRGVDLMRESWDEFAYFGGENHRESSRVLNGGFWEWRETYPAEPYWVHFQTTDVHADFPTVSPFAGLYVSHEEFETWEEWGEQLSEEGGSGIFSDAWEETGLDRVAYYTVMQSLYDEAMAHNDHQIGRLVERLKAEGEWENTLLIIGADHSSMAAMANIGLAIQDSLPPPWSEPMFSPSIARIPLLFVWPGHIEGGQRFSQPVSMIDVLPTILDLLDLPMPEIMMGQSLAPLMMGTDGWEPRPVILDEFGLDTETDELRGKLEVVDGRWGASLEINPEPPDEDEEDDPEAAKRKRPVPLLLYDLWNDPYCLHSLHEEHPDLVEKYTAFLEKQWAAHQALAQRFTPGEQVVLTPEQLQTLRSLGYIQ